MPLKVTVAVVDAMVMIDANGGASGASPLPRR